jgi:outer membrane protein OmpA-like peptidoglycan-associated protein
VRSSRINAVGRGEEQPVASNLTPTGKAQNRRVEIVIVPTT